MRDLAISNLRLFIIKKIDNLEVIFYKLELSVGKYTKNALSPQMRPKTALSPPVKQRNLNTKHPKHIEDIYKKIGLEELEHKTIPEPYPQRFSPVRVNDIKQMKSFDKETKPSNKFISESKAEKLISRIFKKK